MRCITRPRSCPYISKRTASVHIGRAVHTPHIAQRVTYLSHSGPGTQRLTQRVEHVLAACRGLLEFIDPALELTLVPAAAQHRQAPGLVMLDRGVSAQQLVRLLTVRSEFVHPDHDPLARVDLPGDLVSGPLDLGLLETLLDGCGGQGPRPGRSAWPP